MPGPDGLLGGAADGARGGADQCLAHLDPAPVVTTGPSVAGSGSEAEGAHPGVQEDALNDMDEILQEVDDTLAASLSGVLLA